MASFPSPSSSEGGSLAHFPYWLAQVGAGAPPELRADGYGGLSGLRVHFLAGILGPQGSETPV